MHPLHTQKITAYTHARLNVRHAFVYRDGAVGRDQLLRCDVSAAFFLPNDSITAPGLYRAHQTRDAAPRLVWIVLSARLEWVVVTQLG